MSIILRQQNMRIYTTAAHSGCDAHAATRGLLLRILASRHHAARGGIIPGMIAAVRAREQSGVPLWERRAMRLVLGHLYSFNIPSAEDGRKPMPQVCCHLCLLH